MSTLTLTLPVAFNNGVGNVMAASHITTPLGEIETWMNGLIGYDGATDDNWDGTAALRGLNFARGATTDIWRLQGLDSFSVVPEINGLSGGPPGGVNNSPVPGGSLRFYVRSPGARYVFFDFQVRILNHSAIGDTFTIEAWIDGAISGIQHSFNRVGSTFSTAADGYFQLSFGTASVSEGWHEVTMRVPDLTGGATSRQIAFGTSEMVVQAIYR
jgi:hypothetical protein